MTKELQTSIPGPSTPGPSTPGLALLGLFLAAGLVAAAFIVAVTARDIMPVHNRISIKGFAEQPITSDMAVWKGGFTARGPDLASAYQQLEASRQRVMTWFKARNLAQDSLKLSATNTRIAYRMTDKGVRTNVIAGYELTQYVEVTSPDVHLIDRLSKDSTALIQQGVEFTSYAPRYYYTKIDDKKLDLLGAATRDAKARADKLAENSGGHAGRLISASQGVFQITQPYSTETASYGVYDTSTIKKSIKAVVTVQYAVK